MGDVKKPTVDIAIPVQDIEIKQENTITGLTTTDDSTGLKEIPTISTLLRRKRLTSKSGAPESVKSATSITPELPTPLSSPALEVPPQQPRARRIVPVVSTQNSSPPPFQKTLFLEPLDAARLRKMIHLHRASVDMKKLDCMGYFSRRFKEFAFFELADEKLLQGVLGFGTTQLVAATKSVSVRPDSLPSVFELASQDMPFVGSVEGLRAEDKVGLAAIGFGSYDTVGVFPVSIKKAIVGVWICMGNNVEEISQKEMKLVKNCLSQTFVAKRAWWLFW